MLKRIECEEGFGRQNVAKEKLGVSRDFLNKTKKKQCKPHEMTEKKLYKSQLTIK